MNLDGLAKSPKNKSDPNFIGYQNFTASISEKFHPALKPSDSYSDPLSGIIRNRDLFQKA